MGKILCITGELTGLLYSSVELLRRLRVAGHEVHFAGPESARALVEAHGISFQVLRLDGFEAFRREDEKAAPAEREAQRAVRLAAAKQATGAAEVLEHLRATKPDLTLIDGERHEAILPALAAGFRVALLNTFQSIWNLPGMPPLHHRVIPGRGLAGTRAGIAALWLQLRARKAARERRLRRRGAGCDRISVLRSLGSELGLNLGSVVAREHWLIPFTYTDLPVLCVHAEEFEFPHQPPANAHYIGPMLLRERTDSRLSGEDSSRLAALLKTHRPKGRRKLLYAGFGSFFSASDGLVKKLIDAVRPRDDWDLIVSLGGKRSASEFGPLPDHVLALPWVPQLEVLDHADAAICHGAINTYNECILAGVPTLTYGGGETDMPGNAARADYHGIGIIGDEAQDRPDAIAAHLARLLEDATIRSNVERLRAQYARYETDQVAERTVASLLAGR